MAADPALSQRCLGWPGCKGAGAKQIAVAIQTAVISWNLCKSVVTRHLLQAASRWFHMFEVDCIYLVTT